MTRRWAWPSLVLALGLSGCSNSEGQHWSDQVKPGGPCHRANLLDGLDETSTDELRDTFDCLNQGDNLAPLSNTLDALETQSRDGIESGREFARWVNGLGQRAVNLFSMAGNLATGLETEEIPLVTILELSAEVLYGESFESLQAGDIDLAAESSLDNGLIRPMLPVMSSAATAVLNENLKSVEFLQEAMASERIGVMAHSIAGLLESDDDEVTSLLEELPSDLANALEQARNATNDRTPLASGDSLQDVIQALILGRTATGQGFGDLAGEPIRRIFADESLRFRIENAIEELHAGGHLASMSLQFMHFTRVDAQGGSLSPGEDSALVSLLRLLDRGNAPVDCNIVGFSLVAIDNLAVTLLEAMAEAGSSATVTAVELLGLGGALNDYALLKSLVDLNPFCSGLDGQMIDDMQALDRFNDPETGDLLEVLYDFLAAMHGPGTSRVPELVDALAATHSVSAAAPLEELLRDIGDSLLIEHAIGLLPVLLNPAAYIDTNSFPSGMSPLEFSDVWEMGQSATELRDDGGSGLGSMIPVLESVVSQPGFWTTLENTSTLLQTSEASIHELMDFIPVVVAWDPELEIFYSLSGPMLDPEVVAPLMRVVEVQEVTQAIGESSQETWGPLSFGGRLIVSGALHSLLVLIDDLTELMNPS
ncbi:MAG: hypothetical protein VX519_08290 [Myxococcota bacterium]|nr:hypothetical protein [Myxococcota bacterium]